MCVIACICVWCDQMIRCSIYEKLLYRSNERGCAVFCFRVRTGAEPIYESLGGSAQKFWRPMGLYSDTCKPCSQDLHARGSDNRGGSRNPGGGSRRGWCSRAVCQVPHAPRSDRDLSDQSPVWLALATLEWFQVR